MWPTKRFLTGTLVVTLSLVTSALLTPKLYASETVQFIVTAYYSPLPWQSDYFTGSYEWDKRLNGSWVITASWKEVFPWLLAAPRNYPFWTKIYFKWYGIGEVADRWWAIVNAWVRWNGHDRLDIWLWHGDAWLDRARRWGRRTVTAKIVTPDSPVTLAFPETSGINFESLRVNPESPKWVVRQLQLLLTEIWYYDWAIDGIYDNVREPLIDFQLKYDIIPDISAPWAGHFWPRSVDVVRTMIPHDPRILIEEPESYFYDYNNHRASEIYKLILRYGELLVGPESSSDDVLQLQELLSQLWEYSGPLDWVYFSVREPLIDFQLKIWLFTSRDASWAGYFWPRTKDRLWHYYEWENSNSSFSTYRSFQNNTVTLNINTQNQIRDTFPQVIRILENRARRNWDTLEMQLQQFKTHMTQMAPQIQDPTVLARIDFLIALIDTELAKFL